MLLVNLVIDESLLSVSVLTEFRVQPLRLAANFRSNNYYFKDSVVSGFLDMNILLSFRLRLAVHRLILISVSVSGIYFDQTFPAFQSQEHLRAKKQPSVQETLKLFLEVGK